MFWVCIQASSSRRSHEGSYGGGNDYSNRYGYEEKGGYADERGRGYREERRSSSGFRDRSREDYPHRKSDQLESSMPPPSSAPPRHVSSPRGSFRGRIGRGRGMSRMIFSRKDSMISKRRSLMDSSYSFRKRLLAARSQAENIRRLKLQRLRRLKEAALSAKKESGEKDGSKTTEEISEEEKDANWDEDVEKYKLDGTHGLKLQLGEENSGVKFLKDKDLFLSVVLCDERSIHESISDSEATSAEEESGESDNELIAITIKQDSDSRAVSEEGRKRIPRSMISGRPFIRLTCPHCYVRCITFKEYTMHLYTSKHINMMRKQSLRHKQTLARMRMNQRQKQRLVEASDEVHGSLAPRTNFCAICKLNYRQLKVKHQGSDSHRAMKKFLMPYCRVCRVGFKSPMLYENHICSLDHLKREARLEERMMRLRDRDRDDDGSGMDEKELDMDNYMILDSVGNVDDTGDEGDDDDEGKHKDKKDGEEKKKTEHNLGSEYIKKVEVLFCELCRLYLPRLDQPERALSIHCRTRNHLQRYVRYRDDRALRSKAEKIHRKEKENAAKEAEALKKDSKSDEQNEKKDDAASSQENDTRKESAEGDNEASNKKNVNGAKEGDASADNAGDGAGEGDGDMDQDLESGMDDKLWADVDKDLGELLREVEPGNKSSDEDDDSRAEGGRYDRFRYSEKGSSANADPPSEGDNVKTVAEADEGVPKSDAPKSTKETADGKPASEEKKQPPNDSTAVTASD
ncbi:hypothetical protein L9F63_027028 [Diploptera punctata]|uniref:U1-type domain-containing protein n=1 Tax=Diploptera punctata TaxID=6984 RepID=A0AAD8ADN4_DIPPU|nr:hypothetical protein L9F63_027028 [Diploptera punctata]